MGKLFVIEGTDSSGKQTQLEELKRRFEKEKIDAVIHFAGLKAVGESVEKPIEYYHNNMTGTLLLCDTMRKHGVKNIIFSSSATVTSSLYHSSPNLRIKGSFRNL